MFLRWKIYTVQGFAIGYGQMLHLFHVSAAHQFGSEEKVLPLSLFKVEHQVVVRLFQVALISIENDSLHKTD